MQPSFVVYYGILVTIVYFRGSIDQPVVDQQQSNVSPYNRAQQNT